MKSKYALIEEIHRKVNGIDNAELLKKIPVLLESWDIKCRTGDGILSQINISNPDNGIFVTGLRYIKNDGTFTEDIFEFNSQNPNNVSKYYEGNYEREKTAYKGTHKQQNISSSPFTSVNTCSFYVGNINDS